jgi:hypothetical protein
MRRNNNWLILLIILPLALTFGCVEPGKVEQGRAVAFDKAKDTVTIIRDVKPGAANPDYSGAPITFVMPKNPSERGEDPKVGLRLKLDTKAKEIVIYDPATQGFKKISYTPIDQKENVAKDDPLVAGKKFPQVDKAKKVITIYSGRQKLLVTLAVPDEYLEQPESTWDAGDEVRIYFKEPGQALRFMNVTRTDIFKK